jgi:hypothetical protein
MRTIETIAMIASDGKLMLQMPADIAPGQHRIVLVIDDSISPEQNLSAEVTTTEDVDAAFMQMVNDVEYQAEALQIEAEFATAQWEVLQTTEA